MDEKEKNLEEHVAENNPENEKVETVGDTSSSEIPNNNASAEEAAADPDENADDLEEKDGVRYETNDNWDFDADAPTLNDGFVLGNDDFEIEIKQDDTSAAVKQTPVSDVALQDAPIHKKPKNEALKFIPLAIFVAAVIAVLAVLGVRYYTVPNGKEGDKMNPGSVVAEIDGVKVSTGMFNYYYSSIISYYEQYAAYGYFDLDTSVDYTQQYTTDDDGNSVTWADFFKDQCMEEIETTTAYYAAAKEAGVTLTAAQQETIDSQIESLETSASEEGIALNDYISLNFGDYCTESTLRLMLEQYYITTNYRGMVAAENHYSEDEINAYFEEHEDDFKQINFSYLAFVYDTTDEDTIQESVDTAEAYMAKMTDADSVNALVPEVYADYIASDVEYAMESDSSLSEEDATADAVETYESNTVATISGSESPFDDETTQWLFSSDTPVGSTNYYIDESAGYIYVLLKTEEPTLADSDTYSVRHILIRPESESEDSDDTSTDTETQEYTDEEWAAAEEKAQSILDEFNGSDKTEYSFALLAEEYSADTASTSASSSEVFGGLYEGVVEGQMVPEFEAWSFDDARKYGDTEIVKSDYGYHIMFFINTCPEYECSIISALRDAQLDSVVEESDIKIYDSVIDRAIENYNSYEAEEEVEDTDELDGDESVEEDDAVEDTDIVEDTDATEEETESETAA